MTLVSETERVVPGRYFYQPTDKTVMYWELLSPGLAPMNTPAGHNRLVADWNRRDKGKWSWRWEEVLPGDFDHPTVRAKLRRVHVRGKHTKTHYCCPLCRA